MNESLNGVALLQHHKKRKKMQERTKQEDNNDVLSGELLRKASNKTTDPDKASL